MGLRIRTLNMAPETALVTGAVESGIRPLVEALNSSERCYTIASCHGHGDLWGKCWLHVPYILFRSSLTFVRAMQHQLDPNDIGRSQGTHYHWSLMASFHPDDDDLAWTLEAHTIRSPEFVARQHLGADIRIIIHMVQRAVAASV